MTTLGDLIRDVENGEEPTRHYRIPEFGPPNDEDVPKIGRVDAIVIFKAICKRDLGYCKLALQQNFGEHGAINRYEFCQFLEYYIKRVLLK